MTNLKYNVQNLTPWISAWRSGKTKLIRVPIVLENQILNYARRLDARTVVEDDSSLQKLVAEVLLDTSVTRDGKDRAACKRALNAFITRLKQ